MQTTAPRSPILRLAFAAAIMGAIMGSALAADAAEIKERSIKLPVVNAADHPQAIGAAKFAELVEQKSGGKIKIRVYPGGVLGGEQQVASAMQGGIVEASMMGPAQLVGHIKEFMVYDFPFAFANEREADAVLDGPFTRKLLEKMPAKGLVGLVFMEHGYRSITNSKRPIQKMEDIQGLKIRTIQSPIYLDFFNALGANPVPMPFTEVYTALETKTLDGQENPYSTVEASKLYEVQKFMSATRHIYNPQLLMVSKKFWDTLSADERKIFEDAASETRDYQRKVSRDMDQKSRQSLIKIGMQINDLPPQEIARMREKVKPVIDKYTAQLGPELVQEFYAEIEKARDK
jgi:tripartite ATP-independent transporter DctP family solute receptor